MNARDPRAIDRLAAIAVLVFGIGTPAATAGEPAPATPEQMVEALHAAFGDHHSRAIYAKGVVTEGSFTPTSQARALSHAALFAGPALPVTVRFSNFTGFPDISDTAGMANPRGMAIKFKLPDGAEADIVAQSFNGFPVASAAEFRELLLAAADSRADPAKPSRLDAFLAGHPIAKTFLTTQKPDPFSYATLAYFGVNAFRFTDAAGESVLVRYQFLPMGGEHFLSGSQVAARGPDYLQEDMPKRLADGPVHFDWFAQLAGPTDAADDPSVAWPDSNRVVKLGTISIDRMAPRPAEADKSLLFLPSRVPAGIEPADPMIAIRSPAYPVSFRERQ
ncbi:MULTISPECIES: catalase family peroxidase [Rhodomicrobium]|uniref:catalase family peroxidase n=1 Tax=Rhodomicrobium TaxID=1068 RepID=UPI000B4B9884|nr:MULTISPECIES: catalase family peroxidase [Rhodomicrobium]